MPKYLLCLVLCAVLLGACSAQPRKAVTAIAVVINNDRFTPSEWRVPGGQMITLKISNETTQEHEWVLLTDPPTEPFSADDEAKVVYRLGIAAGETRTVTFQAPAAPGEYSAACSKPGHLEKGEVGKLLVVQPGY